MMESFKGIDDMHNNGTSGSGTDFYMPKIGNSEVLKSSF